MCTRLHITALGILLVAALQYPKAESRSTSMQVRVHVVRACSVDTRGAGDQRGIALTCSRGTAAGVVSTGSGPNARVIPVPARQTTLVPARLAPAAPGAAAGAAAEDGLPIAPPTRQVVTFNF